MYVNLCVPLCSAGWQSWIAENMRGSDNDRRGSRDSRVT